MKSINSGFLKGGVSILLCIYFWLPGVFVAVCELIIVVSPLAGECGSCWGARLLLRSTALVGDHGSCWGPQALGSTALAGEPRSCLDHRLWGEQTSIVSAHEL